MTRSGTVTINGINDAELILILKVKEKNEGTLTFNPQQMQAAFENTGPGNSQRQVGYNNIILQWQTEEGLKAVLEVLQELTHKA